MIVDVRRLSDGHCSVDVVNEQSAIREKLSAEQRKLSIVCDHLRGNRFAKPFDIASEGLQRDATSIGQNRFRRGFLM